MDQILVCGYNKCKKYLVDPVTLSCGINVCKSHIDEEIDQSLETYECFICKEQHHISKDGFTVISAFNKIVSLNLHLNDNEKKAANLISQLRTNFDELDKIAKDPENFIFDYISETRNKIDLERERLIEEINQLSGEMLNKLKELEEDCMNNLKKVQHDTNEKQKIYMASLSSDISKWNEVLRTPKNDLSKIDKLIDDANKLIEESDEMILNSKKSLLMGKDCYFNAMNIKFDHKIFGDFFVGANCFLKSSILTPIQSDDLISLCEFDAQTKFKLIYKATRDGFLARNFHSKCDEIAKTLTIIKVKGNSNVFGAYNSVAWDSSGQYKIDPESFIFSLINKDNFPLKIAVFDANYSIYSRSDYGPTFGGGHDIHISNGSNTNTSSYANLGSSFANSLYPKGSTKAQNVLAGSYNFSTEEIEIFQLI